MFKKTLMLSGLGLVACGEATESNTPAPQETAAAVGKDTGKEDAWDSRNNPAGLARFVGRSLNYTLSDKAVYLGIAVAIVSQQRARVFGRGGRCHRSFLGIRRTLLGFLLDPKRSSEEIRNCSENSIPVPSSVSTEFNLDEIKEVKVEER